MRIGKRPGKMRNICALATLAAIGLSQVSPSAHGAEITAVPPVVQGFERTSGLAKTDPTLPGEVLVGELNCLACHAAPGQQRILSKGAPDLAHAGARITPQYLRAYISAPHDIKPGATMPDLLHGMNAAQKQESAEALTHYLVSLDGPIKASGTEGAGSTVDAGRVLYHTVGCVACHAPEVGYAPPAPAGSAGGSDDLDAPKHAKPAPPAGPAGIPSVPLPNLASKTTVEQLEEFLLDPLKARPHSRMPSSNLEPGEAKAIAVYLLRDQLHNPQAANAAPVHSEGVHYKYFEGAGTGTADLSQLEKLKPKSEGVIDNFKIVPGHSHDNFAIIFTGELRAPKTGQYTFNTVSDDGSRLYIDGKQVVDNDGIHPAGLKSGKMELTGGMHQITVTYFQGGNNMELKVSWAGPGLRRAEVLASDLSHGNGRPMIPVDNAPFEVEPKKAEQGKALFASLGCASCHSIQGVPAKLAAGPLAQLDMNSEKGCLGTQVASGAAQYELSTSQRDAIKIALSTDKGEKTLTTPLSAGEQVLHTLAAMNCLACHQRGDIGGPSADKVGFFGLTAAMDLGDEGHIPPKLTGVGAKLQPTAIEQIVFSDELHVRPWMATRMPRFSKDIIGYLPDTLAKSDPAEADSAPPFSELTARDGQRLVGTKGLGCVNCHSVGGVKSLGMPSVDLSTVHDRIRPGWFHAYLVNPPEKNPGTRMPAFWPNGTVAIKDVAGGARDAQIDAIWSYLSLGHAMPLPIGLQPSAGMELIPGEGPIIHRTFMDRIGSRSILVGFPEMVHVAFDANNVRLARAWRGRFFDAKGQWEGRGGKLLPPLGTDVVEMPAGPSFAILDSANSPWPALKYNERNALVHFKGYTLDEKDRPTFQYVMDAGGGTIVIEEKPVPSLVPGKAVLHRQFHVKAGEGTTGADKICFLAAQGGKIEPAGENTWTVDGKLTVKLQGLTGATLRDANGGSQLIVPVALKGGEASFDAELTW